VRGRDEAVDFSAPALSLTVLSRPPRVRGTTQWQYRSELLGFRPLSRRTEHRAPLIVDAMKEDRQQQAVIDVGEISERGPGR
jgi:hypothetical protein